MIFNALVVEKDEETGKTSSSVKTIDEKQLPEGDILVNVEYSTVNYKDGLCLGSGAGLVKNYPHVPGIDFSGTVESSDSDEYRQGDKVILTGWRVGEVVWGGYAQKARVKSSQLVPLPKGLSTKSAMVMGTAGLSAMLAIIKLEENGLKPNQGSILITGASGGVGSVSTAILSNISYDVAAVTGKKNSAEYLKKLGAKTCLLYTSPSPRDMRRSRMPSSA